MTAKRYMLLIEAGPGTVPGDARLKAALKTLWRAYSLRVVEAREVSPDPALEASEDAEKWQRPGDLEPEERAALAELRRDDREEGT